MGLFYTSSANELLEIRNKIVLVFGLPALNRNGFQKLPFLTAWFGKSENIGYSYEVCRLRDNSELDIITIHIIRGDMWIQGYLNIFKLQPALDSIKHLDGLDGLQFHLPPNSMTEMRLKSDDIKGPPILSYNYMLRNHKIKSYYTKVGLLKRVKQLERIIEEDMNDIDSFVKRWYEIHKPLATSWEGIPIK